MRTNIMMLILLLSAGSVHAGPTERPETQEEILSVRGVAVTSSPCGAQTLELELAVADGYHVQANPASDPFFVALEVTLEETPTREVGTVQYPAATPYRVTGMDTAWATYRGTIKVMVPLLVRETTEPEPSTLRGSVRYQACDSGRCLFPATVDFEVALQESPHPRR